MCGIVGYIGDGNAVPVLLDALAKLEYRGYDSAGIAVLKNNNTIDFIKAKGRIADLRNRIGESSGFVGSIGIGHTRWATHGEPNDINSHPHLSNSGKIAVVHNGIIENHIELRAFLTEKGYVFVSQTDTEVIAHLIDYCYVGDCEPKEAVSKATHMLKGSYAIAVLFYDHSDEIIAVRKDSPLIIGLCPDKNMIASDIPAVLSHTRDILRLDDGEMAIVKKDGVTVFNAFGEPIDKPVQHITWDANAAEKDGYEHFMKKEIYQQPETIRKTVSSYVKNEMVDFDLKHITIDDIKKIEKIRIIGCGSAYHAGVVGKVLMEKLLRIPVIADLASEFIYSDPIVDDKTLTISISQSGETIDTLNALRIAKSKGSKTLSIVNVVGSTIAAESDDVIYTHAGLEIAVATTKAYSAQLIVLYMMTLYLARTLNLGTIDEKECIDELMKLPTLIDEILEKEQEYAGLAQVYQTKNDIFFLGRNFDYALALEASLKLKEISYIHSEAYAAGELKHGTISLIEDGTLVIALCTCDELIEKMISNIAEVKTRGAVVIAVAVEGAPGIASIADHMIWLPKTMSAYRPSLAIVPLQLFAYYVALLRGCDIDKPRNLAKSVTVE